MEDKKESCLFCRIARGEIPSYKVYEDNEVLAFLDISPGKPRTYSGDPEGALPRFHPVCPKNILAHCFEVAQLIAQAQIRQLGATGTNVLTNVGKSAGQTVRHFPHPCHSSL